MHYQCIDSIFHGWQLMKSGSGEEGLTELRSCVGQYGATSWTMLGLFRAILAEAELLSGNFEQAEEALAATEKSYREAIAVARGQQAKSLELRAATGLAWLWGEQGRRTEARDLLTP